MNISVVLLIFGGVLVLIAIIGGGFEIRELRIPKVERVPRVVAGATGVGFIVLSIYLTEIARIQPLKEQLRAAETPVRQATTPARFVIVDKLTRQGMAFGQSEQAKIRIDGNYVGQLTVNTQFPEAELVVVVANEGQHSFALEARMMQTIDQQKWEVNCYGTGLIDVVHGARFHFEGRFNENGPCLLWLEKD